MQSGEWWDSAKLAPRLQELCCLKKIPLTQKRFHSMDNLAYSGLRNRPADSHPPRLLQQRL